MRAKEYLNQYRTMAEKVKTKIERIEMLQAEATHITARIESFGSGSEISDRVGKIGASIVDECDELYDEMAKLRKKCREIEHTISLVDDDTLQVLLEKKYILGKTWEQIAVEMNFCYRHTCRLHGIALREVDRLLKMS